MLKPAQLYREELQEKRIGTWYDPAYIYYNSGTGGDEIDLPDNSRDQHCFVSVNGSGEAIGYISYDIDWAAMSAGQFAIISFQRGNALFGRDVYRAICDLFDVYHLNRVEWFCYADNPAYRGYSRFIKNHGGKECARYRQCAKLADGELHDAVGFEIMAEDWKGRRADKKSGKNQGNVHE